MSRTCAYLIGAGLVYLAIPNLLFLMGWFTPLVAVAVGVLLIVNVGRECMLLHASVEETAAEGKVWKKVLLLFGIAFLLILNFLTGGIVGIFDTHPDYFIFRQALFCNLRDAAWPVILPDGREMSYYLSNMLPPALMARVLPASWGQWCIVFWGVLPVFLTLLILAAGIRFPFCGKVGGLLVIAALFFIIRDPLYFVFHSIIGKSMHDNLLLLSGWDCNVLLCPNARIPAPLGHHVSAYNSLPPTLLAVAIMLCGGREKRRLVPLVYALLVAISPIGCMGLLPVAAYLYGRAWKEERISLAGVVAASFLPLSMALLCALYFMRAENSIHLAPCYEAWGWGDSLYGIVRVVLAWSLLVLPLARVEKHNALYYIVTSFLLAEHVIFIGSQPTMNNELWLKSAPAYMLVLAVFWSKDWHLMSKFKYVVAVMCLIGLFHSTYKSCIDADISQYGTVSDIWNGHLNHPDPFLRQSVPPTREALVPGMLLRGAGESERHFPGSLLPQAPGCDYTRPKRGNGN